MPTTLMTGANSFVGAHVINSLIAAGHKVIGTVRRANVVDDLFALNPAWKDHLEVIVVPDYTVESNWDDVFAKYKFDHIVHVAAPLLDNPAYTDYDRDFLKPNVEGNLALLRSAHKNAPTVKSIAVTGSVNASTTGSPEELSQGPITNETWLPISKEQAREMNNAYISYCSGKKEGELALWNFVKTAKPAYAVTVFLPALIFGPPLTAKTTKSLNYSVNQIYSLFNGSNAIVPPTTFSSYIDVRDLADAHVKALTEPRAANRRLLVGGMTMTYSDMATALRKVAALEGRVAGESNEWEGVTKARLEAAEGNELLGLTFRSLDETMADTAAFILKLEQKEQA